MELLILLPIILLVIETLMNGDASKPIWNGVIVLYILGLTYAYGSRCVGCAVYDDYANVYVKQGQFLRDNGFDGFFSLKTVTTEYFFYTIFWIIANLVKEVYWLWALSFVSLMFLYLGLRHVAKKQEIVAILTFASIGLSTQLVRQYMAWSMLLYLIVLVKNKNRVWMFLPAIFVHHSAVIFLIKYVASRFFSWRKWFILFVGIYLIKDIFIDYFLSIDHYSIRFLTSSSLEKDILDYNMLFVHRVVILAVFAILFPRYRSYVVLSSGLFILLLSMPLLPVRLNLLLLSHCYGIIFVALMRVLRLQKIKLIYIALLAALTFRTLYLQTGDFALWKTYNTII